MPWYTPWSDHITKRVCKYLLQRYLGQFLEEKLTLDQLTIDLYNGIGTIADVSLDVQALNDLAVQQNFPFKFMDGFVKEMSVSVPWSSIFNDSSYIEVSGLHLTLQFKECDDSRASMFESMWSSMTSSMQLAEDCIKSDKKEGSDVEIAQAFEGIEKFAHTIDSILRRIKVKFLTTTIRVQHLSHESSSEVAMEIKISSMDYFDEAGIEWETNTSSPTTDFEIPAFSTKKLHLEGVCFYSDEAMCSPSTSDLDKVLHMSPVDTIIRDVSDVGVEEKKSDLHAKELEPILIGRLAGRQEVRLKFKQEGVIGPKVELEVNLGALTIFCSPRQVHTMLELLSGFAAPTNNDINLLPKKHCKEKPMEASDFRKIEQELQNNFYPANVNKSMENHGWLTSSLDGSDDEFTTVHGCNRLNESMISSTASTCSTASSVSDKYSQYSGQTETYRTHSNRTHSSGAARNDRDPNTIVFKFHILLRSLALAILHDDIITVSGDRLVLSSVKEMKKVAENFFTSLGHFTLSGGGAKDFEDAKKAFLTSCQRNHLRLLAAPLVIDGCERATNDYSSITGTCTASKLELLECLVNNSQANKWETEYVQLLKFTRNHQADTSHHFESSPSLKLSYKHSQKLPRREHERRFIRPRTEISLSLEPFEAEIDVTIIDRISALINPDVKSNSQHSSYNPTKNNQCPPSYTYFHQAVDNHLAPKTRQEWQITSPSAVLKIRFPIPDLRPMHDFGRPAWWQRSVRKDVMLIDMTDAVFKMIVEQNEAAQTCEIQCRRLCAKFQEADVDTPVTFVEAFADQNSNTLLDGVRGLGWPRIVISVYPKLVYNELDDHEEPSVTQLGHSFGQSLVATLESTTKREPSPFSSKRVVHDSDNKIQNEPADGQELIIPASKDEIADFIDSASRSKKINIDVSFPCASILLPSKHLYEVIYNRIGSDLLLWEPCAPKNTSQVTYTTPQDLTSESYQTYNLYPAFSLCKSGIDYDTDSDSESTGGVYYSVYEQKNRIKKKKTNEGKYNVQSKVCLSLNVGNGLFNMITPARDTTGNVIPSQHGELLISFEEGNLFFVSGYRGKSTTDYLCFQANHTSLYHNGLISDSYEIPVLRSVGSLIPSYLEATIYKMDKSCLDQSTPVGVGSSKSLDMLTVSLKIQNDASTHYIKTFRVAAGIRCATLGHRVCSGQSSWFSQLIDFFDVDDYPIAGYNPSRVLTEINVQLWDCYIDYRPLHLPLRSVISVGSFNISSNIAAKTHSSTLRFIAEDAALFLSDKWVSRTLNIDLKRDYVCVMDVGLFELSLRLSEQAQTSPKVVLRASTNVVHIRTCSDSAKALTELLMYFASDGDLHGKDTECEHVFTNKGNEEDKLVSTDEYEYDNYILSKSEVSHVNNLMEEAMIESRTDRKCDNRYMDESLTEHLSSLGAEVVLDDDHDPNWENEFCILDNEAGIGIAPKSGLPEVRMLTDEPVRLLDNHFTIPVGKTDLLSSPKHYPSPVVRYTLSKMSLVWHIYGGSDFQTKEKRVQIDPSEGETSAPINMGDAVSFSKSNPQEVRLISQEKNNLMLPWKERGGRMRRHDVLMELQLNKVQFRHEVYPETTREASRQVLLVHEVEIRDRLASSHINKFLYQLSSEAKPRQSHANMIVVKAVLLRSDPKVNAQECCLKVSLLPLRLNIDQDSILFLYNFFNEISVDGRDEEEDPNPSMSPRLSTPTHQVPIMSVNADKKFTQPPQPQTSLIVLEEKVTTEDKNNLDRSRSCSSLNKPPSPPVFFRCFIFSPDVPVKLDYQGKRVDMTHGPLPGILMGLAQLSNSELKLRRISHRHGLLGFDKLINFVLSEWTSDIKKNQLPSLLGGVGPMHSLVQLFHGIRDLFWLPIEQYQKDGRLVRGFQRGANSFTTSTAMAALELTSRLIQIIQSTAETAYDMVSPGPSVRMHRSGKGRRKRYTQPADIREGVVNAYMVVREGLGETAQTIVRVASEEHEQKGVTGAVGGVLRQIPPTVVKPIILATEATNNVLGGMRSQLVPDARKEAVEKWRKNDV